MDKMYHTVYKITHRVTGQFYIGRHSTSNINDGYLGSGSSDILKDKRNLEKEVIKICSTPEEMIELELHLIKENFMDPLCENFIIGDPSYGGVIKHSQHSKEKISRGMAAYRDRNPEEFLEHMRKAGKSLRGHKQSTSHRQKLSEVRRGIPKSDEFKKKVSETLKGRNNRPRETLCKKWKITNIVTNEIFIVEDRVKFCEEIGVKYSCFNVATRDGSLYKKTWLCEKVI